jgi:pimeloyl-ACP methyl ester carboxylesterase
MTGKVGSRTRLANGLLEMRALLEIGSYQLLRKRLERLSPSGDGQPVLMLPGFLGADGSTAGLRKYLNRIGFAAHPWQQGRNPGFRRDVYESLQMRLRELADAHQSKVSLIGHSLGGIYSRTLAREHPDLVRQVITLGTPFNIDQTATELGVVGRLYTRLNPHAREVSEFQMTLAATTPDVPSTAIYSQGDGIAPWQLCMDIEGEHTENVRVPGSHTAMPFNLLVCYVVADRLAQPESNWRPFQPQGLAKLLYRPSPGKA